MSSAVCDASPLIVLAKAGWLALLPKLFTPVYVPDAVVNEIMDGPPGNAMRQALPGIDWLQRIAVNPPLSPLSMWQLGRGESEVLEYARLHPGMVALLDDRAARRAAVALGVKVFGTISIVALGVRHGHIASFTDVIRQLREADLYASDRVVAEVAKGLAKLGQD